MNRRQGRILLHFPLTTVKCPTALPEKKYVSTQPTSPSQKFTTFSDNAANAAAVFIFCAGSASAADHNIQAAV
jgi:hypothetical protein